MKKGGYLGLLMPAAVAVAAAVMILGMYSVSLGLSRNAAELNNSVNLCRSVADIYIAAKTEEQAAQALSEIGYEAFGGDGVRRLTSKDNPELAVRESNDGKLREITVYAYAGGREIYSLSAVQYVGTGGAGNG